LNFVSDLYSDWLKANAKLSFFEKSLKFDQKSATSSHTTAKAAYPI
jgi:hypothetical protein